MQEFWKGPVFFSNCKFSDNLESGLVLEADQFPIVIDKSQTNSSGNTQLMNSKGASKKLLSISKKKIAPNN